MKLEHGVPSHYTLGPVFGMIVPDEFEAAFRRRVGMVVPVLAAEQSHLNSMFRSR